MILLQCFYVSPKVFTVGEELEFGNKVKNKQITIRVESGIYEEHMSIKIQYINQRR